MRHARFYAALDKHYLVSVLSHHKAERQELRFLMYVRKTVQSDAMYHGPLEWAYRGCASIGLYAGGYAT